MISKWLFSGAFLFELSSWASVFADLPFGQALALYLFAHGLGSALLCVGVWLLLPRRYKFPLPWSPLFLFSLAFFVPLIGAVGVAAAVFPALYLPRQRGEQAWQAMGVPELPFRPKEKRLDMMFSDGGLQDVLRHAPDPNQRLTAIFATRRMPGKEAIPILKLALRDPADDVRLLAYSMLDQKESRINQRIEAALGRLAGATPARRGALHGTLARWYWELAYLGLAQGSVLEHILEQAREHTDQALRGAPSADLHLLAGRIALEQGRLEDAYGKRHYPIPDNVLHIEEHFLETAWSSPNPQTRQGSSETEKALRDLHRFFHYPETPDVEEGDALLDLLAEGRIGREDFLHSKASWEAITAGYERYCTDPSFVNYFWTLRSMQAPVFMLAEAARRMPRARMLHSISTGYAGLLGCILQRRWGCRYLLSEHGIYTKERKIDLAQANWIAENPDEQLSTGLDAEVSYIRRLWIRFFERVGLLTYRAANPIVALYEGNRQRQVLDGAEPRRTRVIPNGIDLDAWAGALERRPPGIPPVVGLVGRVVPIKDVKTFIRAMRGVVSAMPEAEGWIVGPEEEDPDYASECRSLVASLGLQDKVKFLGFRRIGEVLPQLGLMVLTSISEAQPLVILEAWAAGAPVVSSDVGSCRELIEGADAEDRALGRAGEVVAIADPQATSRAILALLRNPQRWQAAQAVGLQRVERYYTEALMLGRYRGLYREATEIA